MIGAGFTGLSAALHTAAAGCSVTVLEAREVGWGGSGRAFGQVVPYLKRGEDAVLAAFGPDWGERLIAGAGAGPAFVAGLIARYGIACEQSGNGLLFAAHAEKAEPDLAPPCWTVEDFVSIRWPMPAALPGPPGLFFKAVTRRHSSGAEVWSWALEWNESHRVVGFFGNPDEIDKVVGTLSQVELDTAGDVRGNHMRFRLEVSLLDENDSLFSAPGR